jgi:TonB-linked SusC/RagA family outer membrane protein
MKSLFDIFRRIVTVSLFLGISLNTFGQEMKISGKVIDETNAPLPGVNVLIQGTHTGTITDANGIYTLTLKSPNEVLDFSFVGYLTQHIAVQKRTHINVQLLPESKKLDEVVVVGYGTVKKSDLTSSIVGVKGSTLATETQGNFTSALQGQAAGVQVITDNGAPGAVPSVLIRGFTTINLSTSPLYVIDGVPIVNTGGNDNTNFLNSNDIQSIEILKDASAAAIYGTRASNGVILITTKRGKAGKTKFDFEYSYGLQAVKKPYDVMNSTQYAKAMNLSMENSNLPDLIPNPQNLPTTDWWAAGTKSSSPEMNASLNISGGNEKHQYSIGFNYFKQESFYNEGDWEKFSGRITNDIKLAKWITVGIDMNPRYEYWDNTPNWYGDLLQIDPVTPIMRPANELTGTENDYSKYMRSLYTFVWNPIARDSRQAGNNGGDYALATNSYIDIHPIKNLVFRSQGAFTYIGTTYNSFNPQFTIDPAHEYNAVTSVAQQKNTDLNWTWENTLTYNLNVGKNSASAMVGMTAEQENDQYVKGYREGYPSTDVNMRYLDGSNGTVQDANGNSYSTAIESYLARVTYNYDNRYLLTATGRRDGSSKFMPENKWAFFPSVSGAWRLSNEKFLKNNPVISDAKLYGGWGEVGNQDIPSGVYLSSLSNNYYTFGSGTGTVQSVSMISSMKNPDIKWETIEERNLGLDMKFFDSALSGTVEVYQKITHNMLFPMNYPLYSGYPNSASIWSNIGKMQAKGLDASLNYIHEFAISTNKLLLNIGLNYSSAKMKMLELPGVSEILGNDTRMTVGEAPGYFYGLKTAGIFQNQTEINSWTNDHGVFIQPYARPGDIRFVDVNGDGKIDGNDRVNLGSPYPLFTGGFNLNATYKTKSGDFDLGVNTYFSYGNKVVNWLIGDKYNAINQTNLASDALAVSWHGAGTSNKIPILSHNDLNNNYSNFSDLYLEDGSFLKLKNLQIGYSLPDKIISQLGLTKLRIYVSGQNLWTLTKCTAVDPETSFSPMSYGFAGYSYPVQRTFLLGINLLF